MRAAIVVAVACLSAVGLCAGQDVKASIRKTTNIPAQELVPALTTLARERGFQLVFQSEVVGAKHTQGAVGELTITEALTKLLEGTNLAYSYLDEKTVTIVPVQSNNKPRTQSPSAGIPVQSGGGESSSSPDSANRLVLEEIVVTAQRREQKLIDVPIAVSVVGGEELHRRGATNLQDLQYAIPGLSVLDYSPGQERIQLRGISGSTGLPTVGRYLDELNINGDNVASGFDLRLYDIERIEVLRGPQPTLYGEDSMGGTLHYVTVKPNLTEFGGYVEGEGGAQTDGAGVYRADGALNLPIVRGQLAARVVAGYDHSGGWIDNTATGKLNQNSDEIKTVRATLLWQPLEGLSVSLVGLHQQIDDANQNFGKKDRTADNLVPVPYSERVNLGNLVVSYDAGPVTLLSSTGYFKRKFAVTQDLSGLLVPLLPLFGFPPGYINTVALGGPEEDQSVSEELRVVSKDTGPLHYLAGATFRRYTTDAAGATTTTPNALPFALIAATSDNRSTSESIYGEMSYAFGPGFELLGGLRYFYDRRSVNDSTTNFGLTPPADVHEANFHSINPRFNILYHTGTNGILYLNVAKGFRSGGFNATAASQAGGVTLPTNFDPENLWTYELGTKQELLDHRLSIETAFYYNQWDNLQTEVFAPGSVIAVITNGGKASGPGFDFTVTGRPVAGLMLSGVLGINRMRYRTTTLQHIDGDHIDFTADVTWALTAEYRRSLTERVTGFFRTDFQHSGPLNFAQRNLAQIGVLSSDDQNGLNARLGAEFRGFEAYLFVNNATDWDGVIMPSAANTPPAVLRQPRTAGLGFRASF